MFDEDLKDAKSIYKIEYNTNGQARISPSIKKLETCGVVWNRSLMESISGDKDVTNDDESLLSKINPLKLLKGGKLDCSINIKYQPKKHVHKTSHKECGKYLIIPPPHKYKYVSNLLMRDWVNRNFNKKRKRCDKLISPKRASELLTFLGFHHLSNEYSFKTLMYGKMAQLGFKLKATHLVFLEYTKKRDTFIVTPKIYDIFNAKRTRKKFERVVKRRLKTNDNKNFWDALEDAVQLFPNSIALKFTFFERYHLNPASMEEKYPTVNDNILFPPSIRLANVFYPLQKLGINYKFSPAFAITDFDPKDNNGYDIDLHTITMDFNIYAHTPIGTFTGVLGIGYSYTVADNPATGYDVKKFIPTTLWGIEYYYFLNERYYLSLGYTRNQVSSNKIVDEDFNLSEFSSIFVSVGFYTPELQFKIKNWFN